METSTPVETIREAVRQDEEAGAAGLVLVDLAVDVLVPLESLDLEPNLMLFARAARHLCDRTGRRDAEVVERPARIAERHDEVGYSLLSTGVTRAGTRR